MCKSFNGLFCCGDGVGVREVGAKPDKIILELKT